MSSTRGSNQSLHLNYHPVSTYCYHMLTILVGFKSLDWATFVYTYEEYRQSFHAEDSSSKGEYILRSVVSDHHMPSPMVFVTVIAFRAVVFFLFLLVGQPCLTTKVLASGMLWIWSSPCSELLVKTMVYNNIGSKLWVETDVRTKSSKCR